MHLKLLACEIAFREIAFAAARSPHLIDMEFLPVGHHDDPKSGRQDLQKRIDSLPENKFDAVLVGYGVCNQMLNGLRASKTRLVVPRAHDCITFFLGSKERYQKVFQECPGTYYFTPGWLEFPERKARAQGKIDALSGAGGEVAVQYSPFGLAQTFEQLSAKYGEENARYLMEVTESWAQNYQRGMLIRSEFDGQLRMRERVEKFCRPKGWAIEEIPGDLGLLQRWVDGNWAESDFLVVRPGEAVYPAYNDHIVEARKAGGDPA
jgi:hypothetical protein